METIVSLCKRRGFIFPSSEIYGGIGSTWDYGPLGVLLKNNVKQAWWRSVVQMRDDMVGLDAAILMHPTVWRASGHVENFTDPLVDCKKCKQRFRLDELDNPDSKVCPNKGCGGELTEARNFNLMFRTFMGPLEDDAAVVFLRPETAQGIFVNFKNVQGTTRKKLPFGIAQIGKAFRNEITPGKFTFRTREFEQMEIEYFCKGADAPGLYNEWVDQRFSWYSEYGIRPDHLRLRAHASDELAHYAAACQDVEYLFPWGWSELEGVANRTDYDLKQHMKFSGKTLEYFDEETKEQVIPYVIEPSAGADRGTLAFLFDAYHEDEAPTGDGGTEKRVSLRLDPRLAPMKAAVLPLSKKPELSGVAEKLHNALRQEWMVDYDDRQNIGKRYRRQDEVGTPFCITVDFQTLEDQAVTIRERDSMQQERVALDKVIEVLRPRITKR
ncbi:MAG: glycine--tRNA ligase [Armatimonadetes bacterium]|nr:glycine--tRNA ligase [Armatimonadota bacterium]